MKRVLLSLCFVSLALSGCGAGTPTCQNIKAVENSDFFHHFDPTDSSTTIKGQVQKLVSNVDKLKKTAPAILAPDVEAFSAAVATIDSTLATKGYDGKAIAADPTAQRALEKAQADADPAAKRIDDYYKTSCKK